MNSFLTNVSLNIMLCQRNSQVRTSVKFNTHSWQTENSIFCTQRKTNFLKHFNGKHTLISYKMYNTEKHSEWVLYCLFKYLAFRNHIYHNTAFPHISSVTLFSTKKHIFLPTTQTTLITSSCYCSSCCWYE